MTSVVFICHYNEPLRSTIVPLCNRLRKQPGVTATVIAEQDCDEEACRICDESSINYRRRTKARPTNKPSNNLNGEAPAAGKHRVKTTGLLRWTRRTAGNIITVPIKIAHLVSYLRQLSPDVLVMLDDRTYAACRWIRAAQWLRIPVVTIQWAAVHKPETMVELRAALEESEHKTKWVQKAQAALSRLQPDAAQIHEGRQVWYFRSEHVLGHVLWRAFPRHNPWSYGGGNSDVVAVMGQAWKERLVQGGVPKSRIKVTGHPDQDRWLDAAQRRSPAGRAELLRDLQLPSDTLPVTLIAPALSLRDASGARRGDSTREALIANLVSMAQEVQQLGRRYAPVIKVHPRDNIELLAEEPLIREYGVKLVRDIDTVRLISYSGAMTCQWSTTAMIGHAVEVPVIICDPLDSPSAQIWRGAPGLRFARSLRDFQRQLREILTDSHAALNLSEERRQFVQHHMCLDGRATERLSELVLEYACRGRGNVRDAA